MLRKLGPLAAALMLSASFAVGCGDNNSNSSTSTPAPSSGTSTDSSSGTSTDSSSGTSTDSSGGGSSNPNVQAIVQACKQQVDSNPQVTADIKPDLEKICDQAANGNAVDAKKLAKEICLKIVDKTIPDGTAGKDQALAACDKAGG